MRPSASGSPRPRRAPQHASPFTHTAARLALSLLVAGAVAACSDAAGPTSLADAEASRPSLKKASAPPGPVFSQGGVRATHVAGNISGEGPQVCADPRVNPTGQAWIGVKVDGPNPTTAGSFRTTITDRRFISWTTLNTTYVLRAVVVKGGPDTHVFSYNPPFMSSDAGLRAPLNGGGNVPEISHYTLCYQLSATVTGVKFNDLDRDGSAREAGEPGLAGWTVYVDYDNDAVLDGNEPRGVTNASGAYQILGVVPGTFTIREVGQAGWTCSYPGTGAGCRYVRTLGSGQTTAGLNFGNFRP